MRALSSSVLAIIALSGAISGVIAYTVVSRSRVCTTVVGCGPSRSTKPPDKAQNSQERPSACTWARARRLPGLNRFISGVSCELRCQRSGLACLALRRTSVLPRPRQVASLDAVASPEMLRDLLDKGWRTTLHVFAPDAILRSALQGTARMALLSAFGQIPLTPGDGVSLTHYPTAMTMRYQECRGKTRLACGKTYALRAVVRRPPPLIGMSHLEVRPSGALTYCELAALALSPQVFVRVGQRVFPLHEGTVHGARRLYVSLPRELRRACPLSPLPSEPF